MIENAYVDGTRLLQVRYTHLVYIHRVECWSHLEGRLLVVDGGLYKESLGNVLRS